MCDLAEKVYRLAEILVTPAVQLELCTKFDEPFITPKIFMDYFNQVRMFSFNFPPLLVCGVLGLIESCIILLFHFARRVSSPVNSSTGP